MSQATTSFLLTTLEGMAALFIFAVGLLVLWAMIAYIVDVTQTTQAVRRNYPVIGRFRYLFEHLGEFFRQYFFAMDREELPFNRAQRAWVYRAAKDIDNTVAFGSTRNLNVPGQVLFVNCPFPTLGADAVEAQPVTIGPYAKQPYATASLPRPSLAFMPKKLRLNCCLLSNPISRCHGRARRGNPVWVAQLSYGSRPSGSRIVIAKPFIAAARPKVVSYGFQRSFYGLLFNVVAALARHHASMPPLS